MKPAQGKKDDKPKGTAPDAAPMHESNGKKANGSVSHFRFNRKLGNDDIELILTGLKRYRPLVNIANELDCSYGALLKFIKDTPVLAEMKYRSAEGRIDIAESALMNSIAEGNLNAIFFFLDRMARSRGYGQHHEVEAAVKESAPRIVIGTIGKERIEAAKKLVEEATKAAKACMPDDENGGGEQ